MAEPVRYRIGLPLLNTTCLICQSETATLNDHCNEHGWVRGSLCRSCNAVMSMVDRGRVSPIFARGARRLMTHQRRCPGCATRAVNSVGLVAPDYSGVTRKTTPTRLTPEAREALNRLSCVLTGRVMSDVDLSAALIAVCTTAQQHIEETAAALPAGDAAES